MCEAFLFYCTLIMCELFYTGTENFEWTEIMNILTYFV